MPIAATPAPALKPAPVAAPPLSGPKRLLGAAMLAVAMPALALAQGAPPAAGNAPAAAGPAISVELNKLESAGASCRSYFLVTNRTPDALKDLRLEVYLFDRKGVAVRRIALPFSGIRAERSKVVIFDLADVACADLDKLLVNEVLTCTGEDGAPIKGCADLVATTTRASASFAY